MLSIYMIVNQYYYNEKKKFIYIHTGARMKLIIPKFFERYFDGKKCPMFKYTPKINKCNIYLNPIVNFIILQVFARAMNVRTTD